MQSAADELDAYLAEVDFKQPSIPLICNTDAQPLSAETARRHLVDHLTHPVRFEQSVQSLVDQGAAVFAEVGFGGVLSNLVKRSTARRPVPASKMWLPSMHSFPNTPRIRNST